mgnify:CR=1 FL=1
MEINQTNINDFYNLVQEQLSKITTKEGIDINDLKNLMTYLDYPIYSIRDKIRKLIFYNQLDNEYITRKCSLTLNII